MQLKQNKVFERPVGGTYFGTVIDLVEMPNVETTYKGVKRVIDQVRILWVLGHVNGQPYLDKEGQPMQQAEFFTASVSDKSKLTKMLGQLLAPNPVPVLQSVEDLEKLVLGQSRALFIVQEPKESNPKELVSKIAGITPLPPGAVAPQAPQGFVRSKFRPKEQAGPKGTPVNTYATREAAAAATAQQPSAAPISFNRPANNADAF